MSHRQAKKLRREQRAAGVETKLDRKRREADERRAQAKEAQAALDKRIADRDAWIAAMRQRRPRGAVIAAAVLGGLL